MSSDWRAVDVSRIETDQATVTGKRGDNSDSRHSRDQRKATLQVHNGNAIYAAESEISSPTVLPARRSFKPGHQDDG